MNKGGFSWRRLIGLSALKAKISRKIGVPLTRSGRQRKMGAYLEKYLTTGLEALVKYIQDIFNKK